MLRSWKFPGGIKRKYYTITIPSFSSFFFFFNFIALYINDKFRILPNFSGFEMSNRCTNTWNRNYVYCCENIYITEAQHARTTHRQWKLQGLNRYIIRYEVFVYVRVLIFVNNFIIICYKFYVKFYFIYLLSYNLLRFL